MDAEQVLRYYTEKQAGKQGWGEMGEHPGGLSVAIKEGTGHPTGAPSACRKSLFDKLRPAATAGFIRSLRSLDAKRGAFSPPFHTFSPS